MSLISTANFLAPLRSKPQLIGIAVVAVLVGILRFAASSSSDGELTESYPAHGRQGVAPAESMSGEIDSYFAIRQKERDKATSPFGDTEINDLLQGRGRPSASEREKDNPSDQGNPEKLNEIKRSLGLE